MLSREASQVSGLSALDNGAAISELRQVGGQSGRDSAGSAECEMLMKTPCGALGGRCHRGMQLRGPVPPQGLTFGNHQDGPGQPLKS